MLLEVKILPNHFFFYIIQHDVLEFECTNINEIIYTKSFDSTVTSKMCVCTMYLYYKYITYLYRYTNIIYIKNSIRE